MTGGRRLGHDAADAETARRFGTCTLEALLAHFSEKGRPRYRKLSCTLRRKETVAEALERLGEEAARAVARGAELLLLDDGAVFGPAHAFLDPSLAVAVLHRTLKERVDRHGECLRRRTALVVRSGALRNLHDLIFLRGMGADALCPYLLWEVASAEEGGLERTLTVLARGLEKVISTMGIHEIGGYGKYFASIGLAPELAMLFETPDFCGSERGGLDPGDARADQRERSAPSPAARKSSRCRRSSASIPRIWKMVGAVAKMEESYPDLSRLIRQLEARASPGHPPSHRFPVPRGALASTPRRWTPASAATTCRSSSRR